MSAKHIEEVAKRVVNVIAEVEHDGVPSDVGMLELVGMLVVETARVADRLEDVTDELAVLVRVR